MAGTEVEDVAFAHLPEATAAEVLAFVPLLFEQYLIRCGHMERFSIHLCLWNVPLCRQSGSDEVLRQQGRDMAGRAVIAIHAEDAGRQRQLPDLAFALLDKGRDACSTTDAFVKGLGIHQLQLGRCTFRFGHLGECICLRAFLHESDEWLCPMRGVQRDEGEFAL